jgi:PAS domain S-box-containing protein
VDPQTARDPRLKSLGSVLRERRTEILHDWERQVRKLAVARQLDRPALVDHVPDVLDRIAEVADELTFHARHAGVVRAPRPKRYAVVRLVHGIGVAAVVAELGVLREAVLSRREVARLCMRPNDVRILSRALDRATTEAIEEYVDARERSLESVYKVATAALESVDLDRLLERLLLLLREAAPSFDGAAVLLRGGDRLCVRATSGLEVRAGHDLPIDGSFAGGVVTKRRSKELHVTGKARSREVAVEGEGLRVLYGVPLEVDGRVIGVLEVGSVSKERFSDYEKSLVLTMAERAAIAVHHHLARESAEMRARELEAAIDSMPVPVFIGTRNRVRGNRAALEMTTGRTPTRARQARQEEAPSTLAERLQTRDLGTGAPLPPEELPFTKALEGETATREMLVTAGPTGEDVVLRTSAAPIRAQGQVIGAVSVSTDITDAKRAEAEQRQSLVHLRAILDHAPAAVFIRDLEGRYVLVNRGHAEILGIEPERAPGRTVRELCPDDPDGIAAAVEARDREVLQSMAPIQREDSFVIDGVRRNYLSFEFPLRDPASRIYAVCGIAIDITERKRMEVARDRLVGILGHDLRNPLSAIMLASKMLQSGALTEESRERVVCRIENSANRMSKMISDLLDFTRGHLGEGIPIEKASCDLGAIFRDVVDELQTAHPELRVDMRTSGDVVGEWDRERLAQAASNLIGNAVEHRVAGTPIVVDLAADDRAARFRVENRVEAPIAPEVLKTLFEPFRRAECPTAAKGGLGLGLYIAREIVRAHRGTIRALSDGQSFAIVGHLPR